MSAEAWTAFLEALWGATYPPALGLWTGWALRGWADARRRRRKEVR